MNIKKISIAALCIVSLLACEKESSDSISNEGTTLENQKLDPIIELARNFDKELPEEELKKNVATYLQLNHNEMETFIDERHKMSLEEGVAPEDANLAKDLMHSINDYLQEEYGQSYASADPDLFLTAYETIVQNTESTELNQEGVNEKFWGCGSWTSNGTTRISSVTGPYRQQSISFKGEYQLTGQNDCDLVFKSSPYSSNSQPKFIYGSTTKSYGALSYRESTQNSSKEVSAGSGQKSFEFLIGKGGVLKFYWHNRTTRFANDTKILLR